MKRISQLPMLAVYLFAIACHSEQKETEKPLKFHVTSPVMKDTTIFKEYVCQIRAINHIDLRSQEKGYLQNIYADEGQFVRKGQLLFRIMPMLYEADVKRSQAEVNYADIEFQNTKRLADSNIVSHNELRLAKAKLDKERANLSFAQTHLSFTKIVAPFDGYMDRLHERLGSLIDEGDLLTTLSDNSKMWVYFNVPEAEYLDLKLHAADRTATVKLRMANHELFNQVGKVETIEADFDSETGNIAFRATFPNPARILRHGETGNILMPVPLHNALFVPQKATLEILDKKYVYVVDEHNVLKATPITVEKELPHFYIVSTGISAKDRILLDGIGKASNNLKIESDFVPFEKVAEELNQLHAE